MIASCRIDTGAILALLDRDDRRHGPCVEAFARLRLPLLMSEAVLTELFHLVGDRRREVEAVWAFVRSGTLTVGTVTDVDLPVPNALMHRYRDRPMDFADATLVRLAEREGPSAVFTVDHDDFETYRIGGRRRFRITPDREIIGRRRGDAPPPESCYEASRGFVTCALIPSRPAVFRAARAGP